MGHGFHGGASYHMDQTFLHPLVDELKRGLTILDKVRRGDQTNEAELTSRKT